jgi:geranylgeranyl diphosphate synthase type II
MAMACCEMLGGNLTDVMPFACAIEMIHTYSLIHDDLPSMDNDDYRRGKLTNHKVYGEGFAILAGDALLNKAFETTLEQTLKNNIDSTRALHAMSVIANSSGIEGMIGGQVVDLESENKAIDKETLNYMHIHKTGALIIASLKVGAIIAGASEEEIKMLEVYGYNIGLAFQVKDDILDVEGNKEKLGKAVKADAKNDKSTFVSLMGIEKAKKELKRFTDKSLKSLDYFGDRNEFLKQLTLYLSEREV